METNLQAADRLQRLLEASTPGDPAWYVQPNDLIGGTCVMPADRTPGDSPRIYEVADFVSIADAELIVALHNLAPAVIALLRSAETPTEEH